MSIFKELQIRTNVKMVIRPHHTPSKVVCTVIAFFSSPLSSKHCAVLLSELAS